MIVELVKLVNNLGFVDNLIVVGYCVVYGGEYFIEFVFIDDDVFVVIEKIVIFVLFYNLVNLLGICIVK